MEKHYHCGTAQGVLGIVGKIIVGVLIAAGMALFFGFVVMWLWNWLMPDIFGLSKISFWQGWGLVVLSHILFKSFPHPNHRSHDERWKKHFKEKFFADKKGEIKQEPEASTRE